MFEAAEVGASLSKEEYKKLEPKLREALLKAQGKLSEGGFAAMILVGGVEGAGRTDFANTLLEWMDPRHVQVHALGAPTDEERERPRFWRFWRLLPPKGRLSVHIGNWYTQPIVGRVFKDLDRDAFAVQMDHIVEFESMLARENVRLIKLWFHVSKKAQKKRFERLEADKDTSWRVTKQDWEFHEKYDRFRKISEEALLKTSTADAPWEVIESSDRHWRDVTAAQKIVQTLEAAADAAAKRTPPAKPALPKPKAGSVIKKLDLSRSLSAKKYEHALEKGQARLARLARKLRAKGRSMILAFEGSDAAGKGGSIRRLTQAIDARNYRVIAVAAPTEEERKHPYLWRFWRDLPRLGQTTIYDRSWYGRVLVERLEGFCAPEDWKRAFAEINAFEEQLASFGTVIVKFWLSISPEEQLRRFKERERIAYKQFKIGEEDWRNREKAPAYEAAAVEMIERTSTPHAPWVLVEAEDKRFARIKVLETVCDALERAL
ncbi:MAG: polyphosphate:AMP phosphotransferase [Elusimicrobia bacterium]|nr:polyphosphate:AMP phosphotransferase [Elusimicrobiota bacterium]